MKQRLNQLLTLALLLAMALPAVAADIWVSPAGKDSNPGTESKPLATLQAAVVKARQLRAKNGAAIPGGIRILLKDGEYRLSQPLLLGPDDSGTAGSPTVFRAADGASPIISGGVDVTGWQQVDGNIYKATLNRDTKLRTLFVNGRRCRMAQTDVPVTGLGDWGKFEITGNEPWAFGAGSAIDGIKFAAGKLPHLANPDDVELVQFNVWTEKILCARDLEQLGDTLVVKLQQPYGAIATSMAWAGKINYNKSFVVRNAYELLDTPGEFYFDRKTQTLYYYSNGDNMATARVVAPIAEGLIRIKGESAGKRVSDIQVEGITFSYDHWQLMDVAGSNGFAGIQSLGLAVKYIPGGNWHQTEYNSTDVPRGTIQVENAENIAVVRNRFTRLGSGVAVNLVNDVKATRIEGNYFENLLGNAVNIGHPQHYKIGDGDLPPANAEAMNGPAAGTAPLFDVAKGTIYPAGIEGLCENIRVASNYVRNVSLDFRQVEAITAFFTANTTIEHNDIEGTPYGAITCGWWWGNAQIPPSVVAKNNRICFNRAGNTHQVLDDGGIIYLLGEQPGTRVEGNYVFNGPRCIYPDDGSAYLTITRNVVDNDSYKWMWLHLWTKRCHDMVARENYVKNNLLMDNGTNNTITETHSFREDNWSDEAKKIIDFAGIEAEYKNIVPAAEPEKISIHPDGFKERDVFH